MEMGQNPWCPIEIAGYMMLYGCSSQKKDPASFEIVLNHTWLMVDLPSEK
jgi:hypothetical protein